MVQWKSISQKGKYEMWKEVCGTKEEEVVEKYKVEETKTSAY